jgi:hypothetical protein
LGVVAEDSAVSVVVVPAAAAPTVVGSATRFEEPYGFRKCSSRKTDQ